MFKPKNPELKKKKKNIGNHVTLIEAINTEVHLKSQPNDSLINRLSIELNRPGIDKLTLIEGLTKQNN